MAWAGGVWTATYGTSTGNIVMGMQTYYDRKFLQRCIKKLFMWRFGQKRNLPEGEGLNIKFSRYHDIDTITAKLTEGTNPDPKLITGHEVTRTIEEWGGFSQHSSLVNLTHLDRGLSQVSELWGDNAGRTIDLRTMKEVVTNGSYAIRADNAVSGPGMGAGCYAGSESGTTASTTVLIHADATFNGANSLDQTDNFWIGGQILFTSGKNYGQSRYICDSVAATNSVLVMLPFENVPAEGDTFIISHMAVGAATPVTDNMDGTDVLSHKTFTKVWERLNVEEAGAFADDYFVFVLGPTTHAGFMSDATWIGLQQYSPGQLSKLYNGEIGRYMGFRVVTTTRPFRCTLPTNATTGGPGQTDTTYQTAGVNYSKTGSAHWNLAFGREAFGVTKFPGWDKPKIIVKNPGPTDTSNPLNRFSTVGYAMDFVPCALNGLWCVAAVSGG